VFQLLKSLLADGEIDGVKIDIGLPRRLNYGNSKRSTGRVDYFDFNGLVVPAGLGNCFAYCD
jgi:hypothetical protein